MRLVRCCSSEVEGAVVENDCATHTAMQSLHGLHGSKNSKTIVFNPFTLLHTVHHIFVSLQQDSLLASPIILDLVILTELCQRVTIQPQGEKDSQSFHSVLALLSFLCKAPLVPSGTPVVNAFFRQRASIDNIMR